MRSEHIQQQLVDHGRSQATPIAIIERGTTSRQRVLTGTLADLAELAKQAVSPSLIVIGEVVALRDRLAWFGERAASSCALTRISMAATSSWCSWPDPKRDI